MGVVDGSTNWNGQDNFFDFIQFHAEKLGMTREEYIAHYGTANAGINEDKKKPGPDPYHRGLDDDEVEDKEDQIKKQAKMDDDDPDAYKEMPGDKEAREKGEVKKSKHTKKYDELYGESVVTESKYEDMLKDGYGHLHFIVKDLDTAEALADKIEAKDLADCDYYEHEGEAYLRIALSVGYGGKEVSNIKKIERIVKQKAEAGSPEIWAADESINVNEGLGISMGMIEPFLPVIIGYIESGGAGRLVYKIKKNLKAIPKVINNFRNMKDIARILNKLEKHPKIDGYLNNLDPEGVEVMFQELSMADMKIMYSHLGLDWNPKEYLEIKRKADKGEWANEAAEAEAEVNEKQLLLMRDILSSMVGAGFSARTNPKMRDEISAAIKAAIMPILKDYGYAIQEDYDLDEGTMSAIHQMAGEVKDEAEFIKRFFKEFGAKIKKTKDTEEWAKSLYTDMVNEKFRYIPQYDNKGYEEAQDLIAKLRSKTYRKLDDAEFDEFRRAMIDHFDLEIPDYLRESEAHDGMAYGQLERIIDYANMLRDRYDNGFTFDPWMHSLITKSKSYLNSVYDAIDGGDGEIEEANGFVKTFDQLVNEKDQSGENDQSPIDDEKIETALKKKAKDTGVPIGIIRVIMRRGMAAWKSGHRPGANQQQWGYARVNSFLTKQEGTWGKADADMAKKVRDGGHDKNLKKG